MCIELSFTDDPARLAARPAHRQRLQELFTQGVLHAAGPWDDDSGALLSRDLDFSGATATGPMIRTSPPPVVSVVSVRTWRPIVGGPGTPGGVDDKATP